MSQSHHQTRAEKEGVLFNVPNKGLVKPSTGIETPNIQVWTLDILCPEQYLTDQL